MLKVGKLLAKLKLKKLPPKKLMKKTVIVEDAEKVSKPTEIHENDESESFDHSDQNERTITDTAGEAAVQDIRIVDELCPDEEFDVAIPSDER